MNAFLDDGFINLPKPINKIINMEDSVLFHQKINKLVIKNGRRSDQHLPKSNAPFKSRLKKTMRVSDASNE